MIQALIYIFSLIGSGIVDLAIIVAAIAAVGFAGGTIVERVCSESFSMRPRSDRTLNLGIWAGALLGCVIAVSALMNTTIGSAFLTVLGMAVVAFVAAVLTVWHYEGKVKTPPSMP